MNTGIGDGENLAWKLAMVVNGTAGHALLDSYEAERRPVAAKALESTGAASNLVLIDCVRTEDGRRTTLHAELGDKWALVMTGPTVSDSYAAVVAKRLGGDHVVTLVADHDPNGEIMLVRPDAHLGWRGHGRSDALDRWLTAVARQGRAG